MLYIADASASLEGSLQPAMLVSTAVLSAVLLQMLLLAHAAVFGCPMSTGKHNNFIFVQV